MGEEKSLLFARTSIYWPRYTEDIRQTVRDCSACQENRPSQAREPLNTHEKPAGPWKKLAVDYFEWNQRQYLLIADYYSRFPVLRSVSNLGANLLVSTLKTIFSEYGMPEELVSDQGTQFTSAQYRTMAKQYNIKITHSSPRYPQSNGFIEAMVKVVKQILEKCKVSGSDAHVALLQYRAMPLKSGMASPAELLNQRKYSAILPVTSTLTEIQRSEHRKMQSDRDVTRDYYNQRAREYRELDIHEPVYVQSNPQVSRWQKATVVDTPSESTPRSYRVQLDSGQELQRNRIHLRPDQGRPDAVYNRTSTHPDAAGTDPEHGGAPVEVRRSTRVTRAPERLCYETLGKPK
jgi:transposase InsO family protein